MKLRYYQDEARLAVHKEWDEGTKRTLIVLPTGTGKTIIFCKIAEKYVAQNKRILILAHRGELIEQAVDKMKKVTSIECAIEKADQSCFDYPDKKVVVASVQTLTQPNRLEKFNSDYFEAIVVDEAHHVLAETYQSILKHFDANVLGVTATPDREDMKELGEYFETLAYEYHLPRAIKDEFLCPIRALTVPLEIDLTKVKVALGDYQLNSVGLALEPYLSEIAESIIQYAKGRKTVVFLPLIEISQKLTYFLIRQGAKAVEVNGKTNERTEILQAFDRGEYNVLCNSMLLTEGWDCPSVDCVVCLRPTKIRSLYAQIIGRGTRIHPGKENLLILDFLWLTGKHELCRPAHLIAKKSNVAAKMIEAMTEDVETELDLQEEEERAESNILEARESALAARLKELSTRKQQLVDPVQYEMSIMDEDLASYEPTFGWELNKPTEKQIDFLEKAGINPLAIETYGKASQIIDRIQKRRDLNLATPKQIRCLERYGFKHVGQWQFETANKIIRRIALNNWRIPRGMTVQQFIHEK